MISIGKMINTLVGIQQDWLARDIKNMEKNKKGKMFFGVDYGMGKDYTCRVYGKRLKNGTIKIDKVQYANDKENGYLVNQTLQEKPHE